MPDGLASVDVGAWLDANPEVCLALALGALIAALFLRALANQRKAPRLSVEISPWPGSNNDAGSQNDARKFAEKPPDCMVVIPARNESGCIGRAVRSLPPDSVIVVDDHSQDSTAEEARKAGAGVIQAPDLPRGACGKSNACIAGARSITSKWILFADADTRFAPGFLDAAVARADSNGADLLSVYLDPEYSTIGERVIAPYLIALFYCGANPRHDAVAAFNGQCLLVRRDAYQFLGGHAAVHNALNEDVGLAALAQRHRLKFGIVRANGLGAVRWRELAATVRRGAFRFMLVSPLIGATILIAAVAMAAWLPVDAWLLMERHYRVAAAFAVLPWPLLWRWYGRGRGSIAAVALPFAIYAALPMLGSGLWSALRGGAVEWKGRSI